MLARCLSASLLGIDARPVTVEVDLAPGLPGLQLVGLPDTAIQESRERVRSALRNSGFRGPLVRVVINLAPADLLTVGLDDLGQLGGRLKSHERLARRVVEHRDGLGLHLPPDRSEELANLARRVAPLPASTRRRPAVTQPLLSR